MLLYGTFACSDTRTHKGALRCRCNIVGPKSDLDTLVDRCLVKMCDPGGLPEREINKDTRLSMCAAEQYIHWRLLITKSRPHSLCFCRHNQLRDLAWAIVNEEDNLVLKTRVKRREAAMLLTETVHLL